MSANSSFTANGLKFRHPFSTDPSEQTPPCDTLFIANPPLDVALDEFQSKLQSLRGYQRSKAWPAADGRHVHYLVLFEDEDCALSALVGLYGIRFGASQAGALRCAFAKNRFNDLRKLSQKPPASTEEPCTTALESSTTMQEPLMQVPCDSSREPDLTDPANWVSDFKNNPDEAFSQQQHPSPTRCVRLRFSNDPNCEREIQAIASKRFPQSKIRFPYSLQPGRHSVCYFYCPCETDAADLHAFFDGYRLSSTLTPVSAGFETPRREPPPSAFPLSSDVEEQDYPPNNILSVHFSPNGPSQQMDIKQIFESQPGYARLFFGKLWTYEPDSRGYCFVSFDNTASATAALKELHGQRASSRCRPLRVFFSHYDQATIQQFRDGKLTLEDGAQHDDAAISSDADDSGNAMQLSASQGGNAAYVEDSVPTRPHSSGASLKEESASLWLSHLSAQASMADVNKLFWKQPGVVDVRYIWREQPKPHPICFVDFEDCKSASAAIDRLTGHDLKGVPLKPRFNNNPLRSAPPTSRPPKISRPPSGCSSRSNTFFIVLYNIPRRATKYQIELVTRKLDGFMDMQVNGQELSREALLRFETEADADAAINKLAGTHLDYGQHMTTGLKFRPATDDEIDHYELGSLTCSPCDTRFAEDTQSNIDTASESYAFSAVNSMAYAHPYEWERDEPFSDYHSDVSGNNNDDDDEKTSTFHGVRTENFEAHPVRVPESTSELKLETTPPSLDNSSLHDSLPADVLDEEDRIDSDMSHSDHGDEAEETCASEAHSRKLLSLFEGRRLPLCQAQSPATEATASVRPAQSGSLSTSSHIDDLKDLMDFYAPNADAVPAPAIAKKTKASKTGLLDLPQEIREEIYAMVFNSSLVLVTEMQFWRKYTQRHFPTSSSNASNLRGIPPNVFPCLERQDATPIDRLEYGRAPDLGKTAFGQQLAVHNVPFKRKHSTKGISSRATNSSLLLVNKQVSAEFRASIQPRLMLAFSSRNALVHSLQLYTTEKQHRRAVKQEMSTRVVRGPGSTDISHVLGRSRKKYLQSICLEIKNHGEPCDPDRRPLRFRYYAKWTQACKALVEQLPTLSHVAVSVHVPKSLERHPTQLNLEAPWVQPMLEFGKGKQLKTASVTLVIAYHTRGATLDTGEAFSEVLRRKMMGQSNAAALEAIAEHKTKPQKSESRIETQHSAWVLVERSNGLLPVGLLGEEVNTEQQQQEMQRLGM